MPPLVPPVHGSECPHADASGCRAAAVVPVREQGVTRCPSRVAAVPGRVATALFATTGLALAPRGAMLLREDNDGARRSDASRAQPGGRAVRGERKDAMDLIRSLLVVLLSLLVVLTVLGSLGWLALAVLAGVGWVGKQLRRLLS